MIKKCSLLVATLMLAGLFYLLLYPVTIDPVAWQAPDNPGYTGDYQVNSKLSALEHLDISPYTGPEDLIMDRQGQLYISVHEGKVLRMKPGKEQPEVFVDNLGRPLGLALDQNENLIIADAYQGLIKVTPKGEVSSLLSQVEGTPLVYANNLDIDRQGLIYFTEASSKFGAEENGGSYPASLLDLMEHGGHGRLFQFNPDTGEVATLMSGLNFANGVALAHDEQSVFVNETGGYRVLRYWLDGPDKGQSEVMVSELPAFPDNLNRGLNGQYWVGLVSPRNKLLDAVSDRPFIRKMVQRLPASLRPKATFYTHVIAFDDQGLITQNLQDPEGVYPTATSVFESEDTLYIGSLTAETLAWIKKSQLQ
ncbi:SMP-30/gluconolactonase/LRE family protein [Endozoicomonas arenosclerae]|uniref:SMP-30/gluconolactonase/LRE family protein n=1 Tax=Endozoicomonas arenosclerae TaxID=1633495 RepID=UPI0007831E11|nr:SMP-30/gluconolactonase/LRE family protein [Endozoicomonas arenosclerae]